LNAVNPINQDFFCASKICREGASVRDGINAPDQKTSGRNGTNGSMRTETGRAKRMILSTGSLFTRPSFFKPTLNLENPAFMVNSLSQGTFLTTAFSSDGFSGGFF